MDKTWCLCFLHCYFAIVHIWVFIMIVREQLFTFTVIDIENLKFFFFVAVNLTKFSFTKVAVALKPLKRVSSRSRLPP